MFEVKVYENMFNVKIGPEDITFFTDKIKKENTEKGIINVAKCVEGCMNSIENNFPGNDLRDEDKEELEKEIGKVFLIGKKEYY